jgi:hypothetical protein
VKATAAPFALRETLIRRQNRDGGWGYRDAVSWTESTALALLALGAGEEAGARGRKWLKSMQRPDGGWRPAVGIEESTWVTTLAVLALDRAGDVTTHAAASRWLLEQSGRESQWVVRLRKTLLGYRPEDQESHAGWAWFPGAAAWVMPTALTLLGLEALRKRKPGEVYDKRISEGRRFLVARRCSDGGWNHGSSRSLGYESASYPETTGLAILALAGSRSPDFSRSLACAESHLATCREPAGRAWLRLGLLANGKAARDLPRGTQALSVSQDTIDIALTLIAERALEGDNVFLR